MTEKELSDFIEHGESGFEEFEIAFGYAWATMAIQIAKELRTRLAQPEKEWVGLTDADLIELVAFTHMSIENVRSVEAKLKEKNT